MIHYIVKLKYRKKSRLEMFSLSAFYPFNSEVLFYTSITPRHDKYSVENNS